MPLPPAGPATGSSCSSTQAYIGSVYVWQPPPGLRGLPLPPFQENDNLSNLGGRLGASCADVPNGSSAQGVNASASTTFDDVGQQLAMSNTATQTDFSVPAALREGAYSSGSQSLYGSIVPPSPIETLSVTYTYEVLAESHQNTTDPADLVTGAGPERGPGFGGPECQSARFPQTTVTGDDQSLAVGAHTVTATYTCPAGDPLQFADVRFGIYESQTVQVTQGTGVHGTASSHIAAVWDGGTLTYGP